MLLVSMLEGQNVTLTAILSIHSNNQLRHACLDQHYKSKTSHLRNGGKAGTRKPPTKSTTSHSAPKVHNSPNP